MKTHLVYLSIIIALSIGLFWVFKRPVKEVEITKHVTDTLVVTRIDTIRFTDVEWKERQVLDTVYIPIPAGQKEIPIPISKYRFCAPNIYDITVTGYEVNLTDVTIFPKTEYRTITTTIEKEVMQYKWDFYFGCGITAINAQAAPTINFYVKAPKKWLFGANVGYFNGEYFYGCSINYRISN